MGEIVLPTPWAVDTRYEWEHPHGPTFLDGDDTVEVLAATVTEFPGCDEEPAVTLLGHRLTKAGALDRRAHDERVWDIETIREIRGLHAAVARPGAQPPGVDAT